MKELGYILFIGGVVLGLTVVGIPLGFPFALVGILLIMIAKKEEKK